MARDESGALTLEHQKSNFGPMREPLALEWPADGLPCVIEPLSPVVQGISDKNDTRALLRLIHEFSERDEPVSTATAGAVTAATTLRDEPSCPKRKAREIFSLVRGAERNGYLERIEHRTAHRNVREVWALTPAGETFAEIPAAANAVNAANSHSPHAPQSSAQALRYIALGGVGDSPQHVSFTAPGVDADSGATQ